jgi:thioredoxin 1
MAYPKRSILMAPYWPFNTVPNLNAMPITLSKHNFRVEITKSSRIAIVQFNTEWSGPSQIIDPIYRDLAKSYKGQADFYTIDADAEKGLCEEFMILELPTILFFKDGDIVDHAVGLISKNRLVAKIENALVATNNS